jgi:ABC-type transport system substrate-binding protein
VPGRRIPAVVVAALLLAACPAPDEPRPPPSPVATEVSTATPDTTLRWVIAEPTAIVPMDAVTPDDLLVVGALFDSLTTWGRDLQVQPAAAVRWDASRNGRVWRFELDPDAVFHDGTAVTAGSFVAAWSDMARKGAAHHHLRDIVGYQAARGGRPGPLRGLRVIDAHTLEVQLRAPHWDFPAVTAHPALAPVPTSARTASAYREQPVGNGAFRMAEPWAHGRFVRLTRARTGTQAGHGRPLDEVIFRIQDPAGGYIAFAQGRADVTTVPAGALSPDEVGERRTTVYEGPGLLRGRLASMYFLTFNTRRAPFDDVAVRRAVSQALDRRAIVAEAFEGNAGLGMTAAPPVIPGARQRTCLACVHAPASARTAFRAAGVERIDLWISQGGEHELVARRVRDDLTAAGLRVRLRAVPFGEFLDAMRRGRPGLYRFGWSLDYPTLDNALRPLFHSESRPARGGANYGRYRNPVVDGLLDEARATADPGDRGALLRRAEDVILGDDQAIVPVAVLRRRTLVADRVRGLEYGPLGTADLAGVRVVERSEE